MREQLKKGPKSLVGNKGYRKYLKMERESVSIDMSKGDEDARFDGKWVLKTNTELSAEAVALKYKELWQVELFFKWIKQHLRIKSFYGNSANAVKSQIWVGLCIYLLVAITKKRLGIPCSLYTFLQILEVNLFKKKPIILLASEALKQTTETPRPWNQLKLFGN